jgi:hypothetical protein
VETWPEFSGTAQWQWREQVIPFWGEWLNSPASMAFENSVSSFIQGCVYNPTSFRRLRVAIGTSVAANLTPAISSSRMDPPR